MKRIIVSILSLTLLLMMLAAVPVFAKTTTEVYARQMGGTDWTDARILETPNEKNEFRWGGAGAGTATLYEEDKTTIIDTFVTSSEVDLKAKEGNSLSFKLKMLWVSNTHADSGFEGVAQWRANENTDNIVTVNAVYQGFGYYQGQLLQLEGVWAAGPPLPGQTLTGTLLSY